MKKEFEYRNQIDTLHYTQEEKETMTQNILKMAENKKVSYLPKRPKVKTLLIAAVMVTLLTIGAGATGVLKSASEAFADILGDGPAQTEIIDKIGHPVDAQTTDHDLTVKADAVIGDSYNVCIVYSLTRNDGEIFDFPNDTRIPLIFEEDEVNLNIMGGTHGSSYFIDTVPGDSTIQYVVSFSTDKPLNQKTVSSHFKNLYYLNPKSNEKELLFEGKWNLKFELNYEDSSIVLGGGETFTKNGLNYTIDEIRISPIAIKVDYTVDEEFKSNNYESGKMPTELQKKMSKYLENIKIYITKKDGTVLDMSTSGGRIQPQNGKSVCSKGDLFENIIPLDEIENVTVENISFSLQ